MQRFRDAVLGEANQVDAAGFELLKRTCAAELENLRRMQRIRANKPVPELGEDNANQAGVVPAAGVVLRVADVLDAHADFVSRFIFRL